MNDNAIKVAKGIVGRGIVATRDIRRGEKLCSCSFILVPNKEVDVTRKLLCYSFEHSSTHSIVVMGDISFLNHSRTPNAKVIFSPTRATLVAKSPIQKGQEVFIDYGYDPTR